MIKFYYNTGPNPMKVALFLEEANIDYEAIPVDTRKGEQHKDEQKKELVRDSGSDAAGSTSINQWIHGIHHRRSSRLGLGKQPVALVHRCGACVFGVSLVPVCACACLRQSGKREKKSTSVCGCLWVGNYASLEHWPCHPMFFYNRVLLRVATSRSTPSLPLVGWLLPLVGWLVGGCVFYATASQLSRIPRALCHSRINSNRCRSKSKPAPSCRDSSL